MAYLYCRDCNEVFYGRNKWARRCSDCIRQRATTALKKYQAKNRVTLNFKASKWRDKNPEKHMLINARSRARIKGIPCTITHRDIRIPKICPVFGHVLSFDGPRNFFPTLDELVHGRGYVPGNVQVISFKANRCKSNLSLNEMRMFGKALLKWSRAA